MNESYINRELIYRFPPRDSWTRRSSYLKPRWPAGGVILWRNDENIWKYMKLSSDFSRSGKRNMEHPTRRGGGEGGRIRSTVPSHMCSRLCGCIRLCNELFRTVNCVKQLPSIYGGRRRHGGRNGHVGLGFRVRVINSFPEFVYIHSASRSRGRSPPPTCVFTILQYGRPEWVKTRVAGPFTGVWKYLQEFQIELTGGDFVAPATGYHSPNRAIAPRQPVCFTPRYIRHEPKMFFPLHFRAGIWFRIKPPFFPSLSEFPYISRETLEPI